MTLCVAIGSAGFGLVAVDSHVDNALRLRGGWAVACGHVALVAELYARIERLPAGATAALEDVVHDVGDA